MNISILGSTGLVGKELIAILEERNFPVAKIRFFSSSHSAGRHLMFRDLSYPVESLCLDTFKPSAGEIVFICTGEDVSRTYTPIALEQGAKVIDNSAQYRLNPEVPLVVPEINGTLLQDGSPLIANPNCSTTQLVLALAPIQEHFGLKRVVVSTYQSVSGAGQEAMEELSYQVVELFNQREVSSGPIFPRQIAFNCIPQIGKFDPSGFSTEETKILYESRKILGNNTLSLAVTAVRIPTFGSHSQAVSVEMEEEASLDELFHVLSETKNLVVQMEQEEYPDPLSAIGRNEVFLGRLRIDPTLPHCFSFWSVSDNLRKGAALNAVQIAELLL